MSLKPFVFGATLALTAESIVHKENQTPHPVHEYIQQDPVSGVVNVYHISGSTIIKVTPIDIVKLATKDFL